jgi:hypothetical protein
MKTTTILAPAKMLSIKKMHRPRDGNPKDLQAKRILPYGSLRKPLAKDR